MSNGRCRMHGGTAPRGIAASNYKHGKYSAYMPSHLLQAYERAISDPDLLRLDSDIALVEARVIELLEGLTDDAGAGLWEAARAAYDRMRDGLRRGRVEEANKAMMELEQLLDRGSSAGRVWGEISNLLDRKRSLTEAERRRRVDADLVWDAQQAMMLVSALAQSVRRNVQDAGVLSAISADLARLVGPGVLSGTRLNAGAMPGAVSGEVLDD